MADLAAAVAQAQESDANSRLFDKPRDGAHAKNREFFVVESRDAGSTGRKSHTYVQPTDLQAHSKEGGVEWEGDAHICFLVQL